MGKRVLLIDGNLSGANLGVHLGMPEGYPFSLNHVLRGDIPIDYAVCKHHLGLEIIPASISDIEVKPRRLKHMLSKLLGKRDFILIDSAAGIDNEVRASVEAAAEEKPKKKAKPKKEEVAPAEAAAEKPADVVAEKPKRARKKKTEEPAAQEAPAA